jgi:hypothetical protein
MMMNSDAELDILKQADPAADIRLTRAEAHVYLAATLDAVQPGRARRRTKRTVATIGAVLGLAVGVPAAAYAVHFLALTGQYVKVDTFEPVESGSPEQEVVEISSPDYPDYVATEWPDYAPLPKGYDQKTFAKAVGAALQQAATSSEMGQGAPGVLGTVLGVRTDLESAARCVWLQEWVDAKPDSSQRQRAASVLLDATTWPATVATDGGGVVDWERSVAEAAKDGKEAVVRQEAAACRDYRQFPGTHR